MKHVIHNSGTIHVHSYANLVLLHRTYAAMEDRRWRKERKKFLQEELRKHGKLVCHYCNNPHLQLNSDVHHLRATVDHVIPKSRGGNPWSHDNFVVSCSSCNKKKASFDAAGFKSSKYLTKKRETNKNL